MEMNINVKSICKVDINEVEAFNILCKTLKMEFVLDEDIEFYVRKNCDNENGVYVYYNGRETLYDERGDLFVALRNVAVNLFPNLRFRNAEYIFK